MAKPIGDFKSASDYQYQLLQTNVNLLKLIQLGVTFYNKDGERPPGVSTFQFNFKFCLRYEDGVREGGVMRSDRGESVGVSR